LLDSLLQERCLLSNGKILKVLPLSDQDEEISENG